MMQEIYVRAEEMYLWIGEEANLTKEAFSMIRNMAFIYRLVAFNRGPTRQFFFHFPRQAIIPGLESLIKEAGRDVKMQMHSGELWNAVLELFSRPYFKRNW